MRGDRGGISELDVNIREETMAIVSLSDWSKIQTQKGSNERLFILTRTHSMQIFGEIPFIKPQTTLKQQINGQKR